MDVYASRLEGLFQQIEDMQLFRVIETVDVAHLCNETTDRYQSDSLDCQQFTHIGNIFYLKLAGYAIVANDSGKHTGESRISYRGRKRLRYVLYENAEFREIHEYYRTRKENPLKMQSVVAVACKVIRVFYMILTKDYDPKKLLGDIRRLQKQAA